MAEVKIFNDREGQTLTVHHPSFEYVAEETGDEVVLMKDRSGPRDRVSRSSRFLGPRIRLGIHRRRHRAHLKDS